MRKNWRKVSESGALQVKAWKNHLNQRCCVSIHDVGFQQAVDLTLSAGEDLVRHLSGIDLDR